MNELCETVLHVDESGIVQWLRENSHGAVDMLTKRFAGARAIWATGILNCFLGKPLNDLDAIIDTDVSREEMDQILEVRAKNLFGGSVYQHNGLTMDIWPLKESYLLPNVKMTSLGITPTIEAIISSFPFNIDKVAIDLLGTKKMIDFGFIDGIRERVIEYSTYRTQTLVTDAARAFMLEQKTGYRFGPQTIELIKRAQEALKQKPELWSEIEQVFKFKTKYYIEPVSLALR